MSIIGNPIMAGVSGPAASIFVTGLSETDTVTATKGSKTLTGKWTQKPNPVAHGLPDGYTELEYIEANGSQYIVTDWNLKVDSFEFEFDFTPLGGVNYGSTLLVQGSSGEFINLEYNSGKYKMRICATANTDIGLSVGTRYLLNYKNNILSYNDWSQTMNWDSSWGDTAGPLIFFGRTGGELKGSSRLYRFWGKDSNGREGNYIPCKKSDGQIGVYDTVSNQFYGNSGTGEFTAGAEVPQTFDGFMIKPIRDFGTWTVTATDGTNTATQDVLVDVITDYEIEMSLSA